MNIRRPAREALLNAGKAKPSPHTRAPQGSEATNRKLSDLEQRLLRLKRDFEMYFNGFEKLPPLDAFERLKTDVRSLTNDNYSTAVLQFKVTNFISRFNQFRALWERQLQQFEVGQFKTGRRVSLVGGAPRGTPDALDE